MKKAVFILLLTVFAFLSHNGLCWADGSVDAMEPIQNLDKNATLLEAYDSVIQAYQRYAAGERNVVLWDSESLFPDVEGFTAQYFSIEGLSILARYECDLGYCFYDLNEDGTEELIIGAKNNQYECYDNCLFDAFTLLNGVPKRVFVSSERITLVLLANNFLAYSGSGGAGYGVNCLFKFNGTGFDIADGIMMENGQCFRISTDSSTEKTILSLGTPISLDEYVSTQDSWMKSAICLEYTLF